MENKVEYLEKERYINMTLRRILKMIAKWHFTPLKPFNSIHPWNLVPTYFIKLQMKITAYAFS